MEDRTSQEVEVTANLDRERPVPDVEAERTQIVEDRDGRIGILEDELAMVQRELEDEKQQRKRMEVQIQTQQRGKQSRIIQTDEVISDQLRYAGSTGGRFGAVHWVEMQDRRRKEEARWNELRSDIEKMHEVLAEVRERTSIGTEIKPGKD